MPVMQIMQMHTGQYTLPVPALKHYVRIMSGYDLVIGIIYVTVSVCMMDLIGTV